MKKNFRILVCLLAFASVAGVQASVDAEESSAGGDDASERSSHLRLSGLVVDAETGQPIESRVHLRDHFGQWHFVESVGGTAVHYDRDLPHLPDSPEVHTTLSNDPFVATLPPGQYTLRVERGKEYIPFVGQIVIDEQSLFQEIRLRRWVDMSARGWYSGDTHVHRCIEELPNIMLAEDLNVALPISYWVRKSGASPTLLDDLSDLGIEGLTQVDPSHVIYARNTEYEIMEIDGKNRTLGAVFVLNHESALDLPVPPVAPVARQARREGALLDLDKHSWPWSLMIIPLMDVDLFELSNNHVWQTGFGFPQWTIDTISSEMQLQQDDHGLTEWGWIDYGFQTYYALVNCGFRLRVTAGTASGVHPVPLGFGRVYVRLPDGFSYGGWIEGLNAGQSFVSTGPMLDLRFNGQDAGHHFPIAEAREALVRITGTAESRRPLRQIEIVVNGEIAETITATNEPTKNGGFTTEIDVTVKRQASFWTAVRCFEAHPENRVRFAHTNPVYIDLAGSHVRPRRRELEYFISRLEEEISRLRGVVTGDALAEYEEALQIYREIGEQAK